MRIIAINHIIQKYGLDAMIIPHGNRSVRPLWVRVFGDRLHLNENVLPSGFENAVIHRPTSLDWFFGSVGWNVFESVLWENGWFDTKNLQIELPKIFKCGIKADVTKIAMIFPQERTDGNRVWDSSFWMGLVIRLKDLGYQLYHLGTPSL